MKEPLRFKGMAMLQNDETIEILMDLGLTCLQAKTYLALTALEKADAKKISKISNVARQDIYRIIPALEKLGLAEKIIATPTLYKATPLKEGSLFLLQKRTNEHTALQQKIKLLVSNDDEGRNINANVHEETSQFIVTSEEKLFKKKMDKAISEAQLSQDTILPSDGIKKALFYQFQLFKRAMERAVKIRIITERSEGKPTRNEQAIKKNPLFELKYNSTPIPVVMVIFDNKEVNINIADRDKIVPSLWTNSSIVVKLAENYFENMWNNTQIN
jgi:sugar-specific transcriptional regulator TrmB